MENNNKPFGEEQNTLNYEDKQNTYHTNYNREENTLQNQVTPKKSNPNLKSFFVGLIGGLIPSTIVILLIINNVLPIQQQPDNTFIASASQQENEPEIVTTLATDDAVSASSIEEASKAVVGVVNLRRQSIWTTSEEAGTGSGIIYKKEDGKAYVVTNHHVVDGAEEVEIVLNNEDRIAAKVLGSDELTDLAILQVDGSKIDTVASLGSSSDIKVGETVLAIGNPLGLEFANSLTKGIISGKDRSVSIDTNRDGSADWITEVIQTDAAINPGNSGGALVDADGKVIGINSMKIATRAVEGIGFAIPIDSALPIMEQLEVNGEVARPFIGISTAAIHQVPPQYQHNIKVPEDIEGGMVIASVETGSPADYAGLQQFDVITKINGEAVTSILELRKYMYSETSVGETVSIEIYRNGEAHTVELELADRDSI
ncbi:S1C family serine protease [Ornithinibacillus halophilus]|uniref:Serine protease Do n=1 Tax=Ornithinibacillus halophilus TaxID=930117 RepID=A0A1M5GXY2_9BACI|nr:trypsin-like peptidase domain-containing protein [Ornithinibacillus halophilus]SHG08589.1 serine protease Do [Ornithinibacillus halophilus]